jgi:transposase
VLTRPSSVRVFVATEPMDVRKSFDGLSAAAQHVLEKDPMSGHLFVFFNRRGNQVRCLFWDRTAQTTTDTMPTCIQKRAGTYSSCRFGPCVA